LGGLFEIRIVVGRSANRDFVVSGRRIEI